MTVLVAYSSSAEGAAALDQGRRIAHRIGSDAVVFDLDREGTHSSRDITRPEGVSGNERWLGTAPSTPAPAEDLLDIARELNVEVIIVGVRRRSAVGKLILGSQAQRIILDATVPVVSVKAREGEQ